MKLILGLLLLLPFSSHASFVFQYGLNYSSEKDSSSVGDYEKTRTFHKVFLGASVNQNKTLFFGWNLNSWTSSISQGTQTEDSYKMLEMGPRMLWFFNDNYNFYFTAEWNPYARGDREKVGTSRDIQGSSLGFGLGYRFRISRLIGIGASLNYHALNLKEEKIASTENNISDKVNNVMPMLELSFLTK